MAKPQLNELFEWLKKSSANRFEIYDVDRNQTIEKCAGYEEMTSGGATLEEYFTRLLEKGVKTVQLVKKRKNGSTYIREGCGLNYSLSTGAENNVAASGSPVHPGATPQQNQFPSSNSFSFGLGSPGGLGVPELMNMNTQAERYRETKLTADELKAKVETLQAENARLDRQNLILENDLKREKEKRQEDKDKEPPLVNEFLKTMMQNPTLLPQILSAVKGGSPNPGLNAPVTPPLSETKSMVIDTIENKHVSDNHVSAAYYVLVQAASDNKPFMEKYHQLLTEFDILQHGSDSDSDSI